MNKSEIGNRLADRLGLKKAVAKDADDGVFEAIGEALATGEEMRIPGFGRLSPGSGRPVPGATRRPARFCQYRLRGHRRSRQEGVSERAQARLRL